MTAISTSELRQLAQDLRCLSEVTPDEAALIGAAADEIEELREQVASVTEERRLAVSALGEECDRLRASLVDHVNKWHVELGQEWSLGYEEAEDDIIEFLNVRAHDPWPDSQWPAANEVLKQMMDEIGTGEHRDMSGEEP